MLRNAKKPLTTKALQVAANARLLNVPKFQHTDNNVDNADNADAAVITLP